jgi:hypothetical protein
MFAVRCDDGMRRKIWRESSDGKEGGIGARCGIRDQQYSLGPREEQVRKWRSVMMDEEEATVAWRWQP